MLLLCAGINVYAGTYTLTIAGTAEDAAATGDLDITEDIIINGSASSATIIDGNAIDRVFDVLGAAGGGILFDATASLTLSGSTISGNTGGAVTAGAFTPLEGRVCSLT